MKVLVKTNCRESKIILEGGIYKVNLKAKPIGGEANKELIKLLSKNFKTISIQ